MSCIFKYHHIIYVLRFNSTLNESFGSCTVEIGERKEVASCRVQEVTVDLGLGYRHTTAIVEHDLKRQETRVKKSVGPGPGMVVREERNKTSHRVGICRPGARQPASQPLTSLAAMYLWDLQWDLEASPDHAIHSPPLSALIWDNWREPAAGLQNPNPLRDRHPTSNRLQPDPPASF